jgi:hypothetical protein
MRRLPDTHDAASAACAEVAEMIVIGENTAKALGEGSSKIIQRDGCVSIENLAFAQVICQEAYDEMAAVVDGVGQTGFSLSRNLAPIFMDFLKTEAIGSHPYGVARAMLLMGDPHNAERFLAETIVSGHQDLALPNLHQCLKTFLHGTGSGPD